MVEDYVEVCIAMVMLATTVLLGVSMAYSHILLAG
jgi:hypothetical protein